MARTISVLEARDNLRHCAKSVTSRRTESSVLEAKARLLSLDEELDLPPLAPAIDEGRYKDAMMLTLSWSLSSKGLKLLYPLVQKFVSLKLFK